MIRRVGILGGGPAGLYLAMLIRRRRPDIDVIVIERSPADATWGFGVVLADGGLRQLEAADPGSYPAIRDVLFWTEGQIFTVSGEDVPLDKSRKGGAVKRLDLLRVLQAQCRELGVALHFNTVIADLTVFDDCDVVVGADGSNSLVRDSHARAFGTEKYLLTNRFAWFGVDHAVDQSHLNFKPVPGGALVGHYYPYAPDRNTFVMECDAPTWEALGLDVKSDSERRRITQSFFRNELGGAELVENNSIWRQFPVITNENWFHDRFVLVGDALRTAHFSIGSGTRMALEDAIALADALTFGLEREAAFARYVEIRAPAMEKLRAAAERSFSWYERFSEKIAGQSATSFALSFLRRTGRISDERLLRDFPAFVAHAREKGLVLPKPLASEPVA